MTTLHYILTFLYSLITAGVFTISDTICKIEGINYSRYMKLEPKVTNLVGEIYVPYYSDLYIYPEELGVENKGVSTIEDIRKLLTGDTIEVI